MAARRKKQIRKAEQPVARPIVRKTGERCFWLMKSEPSVFSIEDLRAKPDSISSWDGVRNYQARNYMMQMLVGDGVLFYHSSDDPVGVAGLADVVREAYPDHTSWDPASPYHDAKSTPEKPRWFMVDVKWVETLPELLPLAELRGRKALSKMLMLRKGSRLSVTPVTRAEWDAVLALARRTR